MMPPHLVLIDDPDDTALHRNSDAPHAEPGTGPAPGKSLRHAAVLIPLVRIDSHWQVLFIRRAHRNGDRHSGQVAFPGGAREAGDTSLEHTALRETEEEIGIPTSAVCVLGTLDPYYTVSDYQVTPIVGITSWPQPLVLEITEVARAFLMPLEWLRRRENFTLRARSDFDPQSARRHPVVVYNAFDGETLWGATARMTLNFIKALDDGLIRLPD